MRGLAFSVGRNFSILSAAIVGGLALSAKTAVEFESAMADVRKVVNFPTPEAFAEMGKEIRELSTRLPVAAKGLAAIAAAAGQAGVAADDLAKFTELVSKVSIAFELTAEDAGTALAKIKTALGLTIPEVEILTDAMNTLANGMAASEADVLEVVNRTAALGDVAGVAAKDIAAIGAAMVSTGVDSERAATGLRNVLLALGAGEKATEAQRQAFQRLGLDSVTVARRIQREGAGVLLEVFERIKRQAPEVRAALTESLFDKRAVDAVVPLINNLDVLRNALGLVADEATFAGSAQREFDIRAQTSANQLQLFQNAVDNLRISIGDRLLPTLTRFAKSLSGVLNSLSDAKAATIAWGVAIAGAVAAIGPLLFAVGTSIRAFVETVRVLRVATPTVAAFARALGTTLGGAILGVSGSVATLLVSLGLLSERQLASKINAEGHADAMRQLDDVIRQIKDGVPGATHAFDELSRAQQRNVESSIAQAEAMLETLRSTALAEAIGRFGDIDDPEIRRAWENADIRVQNQLRLIDALEGQLDDLKRKQAEAGGGAADSVGEAGQTVVRQTEKTIQVIRGGQVEIRTLGEAGAQSGEQIVQGMLAAGDAVEGVSDSIAGVGNAATNAGIQVTRDLGEVVQRLGGIGPQIERDLGGVIQRVATSTREVGEAAVQSGEAVGVISTSISAAASEAAKLGPEFANAVIAFEELHGAIAPFSEEFRQLADEVGVALRDGIVTNTVEASEAVKASLSEIAADVARETGASTVDLKNALLQMAGQTDASFAGVVQGVAAQFGTLEQSVRASLQSLRAELEALRAAIDAAKAAAATAPGVAPAVSTPTTGGSASGSSSIGNVLRQAFVNQPKARDIVLEVRRALTVRSVGPVVQTTGPAFASEEGQAGATSRMVPINLNFNTGGSFRVIAPEEIVDGLARASRQFNLASAGKVPGVVR